MSYTLKLPSGVTFTMCPSAVSEGAEVSREYARDGRLTHHVGPGGVNPPITRIGKRDIVARKRKQKIRSEQALRALEENREKQ